MEFQENTVFYEDFPNMCRLCLQTNTNLEPIFKEKSDINFEGFSKNMVEIVHLCIGIMISHNDGLPQFMCKSCSKNLLLNWKFRQQCIESNDILEKIVKLKFDPKTNIPEDDNKINENVLKQNGHCNAELHDENRIKNEEPLGFISNVVEDVQVKVKKRKGKIRKSINLTSMCESKSSDSIQQKISKSKNKPVQCQICGIFQKNLTTHMLTHTGERKFQCDYCGKRFSQKSNLKFHMDVHTKNFLRPYKCSLCPETFTQRAVVQRHMLTHTGEARKLQCLQCNRRFPIQYQLQRHMEVHTQDRKYKCDHCGKLFLKKGGLKNHIGIHTGERPFPCGFCPMRFINTSGAAMHRKTHFVNNHYKCHVCGMEIKTLRFFRTHLKGHTEEEYEAIKNGFA